MFSLLSPNLESAFIHSVELMYALTSGVCLRFGRKKVLFTSLAAEALVILAQSFSHSWLLFCFLYFFVGTFQISLYLTAFVLGKHVMR